MLYIIIVGIIILIVSFYILSNKDETKEHNIMDDIPVVNTSREELKKHAFEISNYSDVTRKTNCRRKLIQNLDDSYRKILSSHDYLDKEFRNKNNVIQASEWLLDNLYLIQREYKDIKRNMPEAYYRNLPVLSRGIMRGYPRIYYIAIELVSHTDGKVDKDAIETFINAYQKNTILTSGELWAFPTMLRIALIQNISKVTERITLMQRERKKAEVVLERIINPVGNGGISEEIRKLSEEKVDFSAPFVEKLLKGLRDNGVESPEVYKWIDHQLDKLELNTERVINLEHQKQSVYQISLGNSITGIREVGALNWSENFERLSYLESILRKDPLQLYEKMDFQSRDHYRHRLERLAKYIKAPESFIAKKAIECAEEAFQNKDAENYEKHVGYYIIDEGVECLKRKIDYKEKGIKSIRSLFIKANVSFYIRGIVLGTVILTVLLTYLSSLRETYMESWRYVVIAIVALVPCSEIVISILNWSINKLIPPRFIPKIEFENGIPEEFSTIVVIPTLLNDESKVKALVKDLEVYYLANKENNMYFSILGDFKDSHREHEEDDTVITESALKLIEELNKKYCKDDNNIFYFFNRYRQFNKKENLWLGWERKRGKLIEFGALIRGDKNTSYNVVSSDISNLQKVKYIITLDADTKLPRDSAKRLIGAMAHILNRPYVDAERKKVLRGHGLMQPRISVGTLSANKTLFSKVFSGETGIDVYTTAISDVYQDLFDEGIFTGKGIYDVDVFNQLLKDEIPENAVLSHDLLEGSYVRAALVTDIELIDGYPAYYNSSSKRLHRWVRGDWQLIPWLFKKTSLNRLSKWKIFDNLRRSLLAPSIITLTIIALAIFSRPDEWLLVAFISLICPILFDVSEAVVSPIKGISLSGKVNNGKNLLEQFFLIFSFLPYQAWLMLDAIVRTLYRLYISKKNLLQWQTAEDVEQSTGRELKDFIVSMWPGSMISVFIAYLAFMSSYETGLIMLPSSIIWFLSPLMAYSISKNVKADKREFTEEQKDTLRRLSRKTWAYFEDFVSEKDNWLAPDNYQEDPANGIASRTSPTNMGMGLTSNTVAYDLGYIGVLEFKQRIDRVVTSMESLERYKGHFYNWYDTRSKNPLYPRYISTVDSGNLVSYIWLVNEAIREQMNSPLLSKNLITGLEDTLKLAGDEIEKLLGLKDFYADSLMELKNREFSVGLWKNILSIIWGKVIDAERRANQINLYWNEKLKHQVGKGLNELKRLTPWLEILEQNLDKFSNLDKVIEKLLLQTPINKISQELQSLEDYVIGSSQKLYKNEDWINQLVQLVDASRRELNDLLTKMDDLIRRLNNIAEDTSFRMLYDEKRQLFTIGYDVERDSLGNSYYDLLASEARQASFIAIARGEVKQSHWFALGRALTLIDKSKGLVSWTGTMFEYLMPLLVMKNYPDTLLDETYKSVVEGQKRYGMKRGVPWGISESAYYYFDLGKNYQYKAFGVPGIGLKRGLANELVIAPYATVMALQVDFRGAFENIKNLINMGLEGKYGFYESVDYTKERLQKGCGKALVKCFMVHHEGMSLMALDNALKNNILQQRFHRIPEVKATELLLQEKLTKAVVYDREQQYDNPDVVVEKQHMAVREYNTVKTEIPETHLISNGNYALMITNSGSGYSKNNDMTIYRWREDATVDDTGMFFYIKNLNCNEFWSATYEPCKYEGEEYSVAFSLDKAEFKRKDGNIRTHTEVTVSTEDNAEVRRISITNSSEHPREVEITSYCEVTLAPYNADLVHPAFSNLFIKTEFVDEPGCILANRRPRAKGDKKPWVMQTVALEGNVIGSVQYETSRANFIGRGRDLTNPQAMDNDAQLGMTVGAVLDPIISMRVRVRIEKGETCTVAYATAVANSREEIVELGRKYSDIQNINRTFELSWTGVQVELKYLGIKSSQANIYQLMASKILFISSLFKDRVDYITKISKSQSALWPYGISGDLPIVLLIIRDEKHIDLARQLLNAHEYWSIKGLKVDLVIINLQGNSYIQSVNDTVRDLISSSHARDKQNKAGGVFLHNTATIKEEDIELLIAIARLVIDGDKGSLISQVKDKEENKESLDLLGVNPKEYNTIPEKLQIPKLHYFNGIGGFNSEANSYVILLNNYNNTPAPWINVISNGKFGFHVSESGISYSWNKNSRENKLTTWSNDPVIDSEAEQIYIRDEDTGKLWSISPKPIRDEGEYLIEHGFGYSTFKHEVYGILGEMTVFVDMNERVKLCKIRLKNNTNEERKLSINYYAKLVLGVTHEQTAQYIFTGFNDEAQYIYAKNPYSEHFGKLVCYLKVFGGEQLTYTGRRVDFIGRGESIRQPKGLKLNSLPNTVGAGFDPCLAESVKITLNKGESKEILVMLGQEESFEDIERVTGKYMETDRAEKELINVKTYWKDLLGTIQVETPDKSMDLMINGWLMYQVISCRYWARTAFYQSGGAYGFRDQLQDVMAVGYLEPEITRKQIIYSASRQYLEGDVQHWWHPVVDSGIRTRFSDDLLWLPFVVIDYIQNTGDLSILDEEVTYLEDEELKEGEDERYNISRISDRKGSIYEHCVKAIERGLRFGPHNIPLMGSGDWNDGMSTVGNKGKGESVWLGWFLYSILDNFVELSNKKEDWERAKEYERMKEFIRENLEKNAWDGGWYRRAYFDDGTPLGSKQNDECQIDSLSQSWSVISGAAKESRAKEAMEALQRNLIKEDKGIVLLLTPAFDKSFLEPGYIKGYVPGVRENGGQYTHASIWVILAMAKMGLNNDAWRIFHMINPINHSRTYLNSQVYKVEPYVMTADVYAVEPHTGRGGWSWYTGAAGWMYRTGIESILGFKFVGSRGFTIAPCVPDSWQQYKICYSRGKCKYNINIERGEEKGIWIGEKLLKDGVIPILQSGEYEVKVVI
ncbi:glucoamylase family protein [Clostridium sp. A1-XYC3]|uniref:Glucoamylase family protein n=1 Tax=Clostridium tanneri TaxID=3037988 RepID=A0ABU4JPK4_9CLOT|nr:glucoamylase family protein [Clostridium sp. A1-XYC3]MDW8800047.1 glucoamylase family protein [Clostridium sp. A1-XYC3]